MEHNIKETILILILSNFLIPTGSWAKSASSTEIHVNLLGQSCLLKGPFDESTLKTIHSVGPAQIYPNFSSVDSPTTKGQTQKALEQLRNINNLPSLLDRYKEKLGKRLGAQAEFFSGLQILLNDQDPTELNKAAKKYLKSSDQRAFENGVKKLQTNIKSPAQRKEFSEQLFDLFNESIEKDPEEDFHRAIKKLNIQYICSFEESDD